MVDSPESDSAYCTNHEPSTANYQLKMRAMLLEAPRQPLRLVDLPAPKPDATQVLVKVVRLRRLPHGFARRGRRTAESETAAGARTRNRRRRLSKKARASERFKIGDRVGIPWLGWTCGECEFCRSGRENLCDRARFTGYTLDGGYAEFTVADERFCFPIPESLFRRRGRSPALRRVDRLPFARQNRAARSASAFMALARRRTSSRRWRDFKAARFSPSRGAAIWRRRHSPNRWARSGRAIPKRCRRTNLDAAIIFAPVGELVPLALKAVAKGGTVVCGGIHMSDIPSFPYDLLWQERTLCSVANLTRRDGEEFFALGAPGAGADDGANFPAGRGQ